MRQPAATGTSVLLFQDEHLREELWAHTDAVISICVLASAATWGQETELSNLSRACVTQPRTFREFLAPVPEHNTQNSQRPDDAYTRCQDHEEQEEQIENAARHRNSHRQRAGRDLMILACGKGFVKL